MSCAFKEMQHTKQHITVEKVKKKQLKSRHAISELKVKDLAQEHKHDS